MRTFVSLMLIAVTAFAGVTLADKDADQTTAPVVCFGDSITKHGYPADLAELLDADVTNAGVGGQTTRGALKRFQRDVLNPSPRVVVIFFGTNDSRLAEPHVHVPLKQYARNLSTMIKACKEAGIDVVLCTLPPIDADKYFERHRREPFEKAGGLDKVLDQYRRAALDVAKSHEVTAVDLHTLLPATPQWMSDDGVHPTREGRRIIAEHVAQAVKPLLAIDEK